MPKRIVRKALSAFLMENGVSPVPSEEHMFSNGHTGQFCVYARAIAEEEPTHNAWAPYAGGQNVLAFFPVGFKGETYLVDQMVRIAEATTSVKPLDGHVLKLFPAALEHSEMRAGVLEVLVTHFENRTGQEVTIEYPEEQLLDEEEK